jgi:predicted dehydrogenase
MFTINVTGAVSPQARGHKGPLKLGIVGCGRVTETRHLPALQHTKSAEVVALADISQERLNRVANLFHVKDRYTRYQQLLDDASIDAVAVCVPAHSHIEVSVAALDAGKHVFVEKPLALGLDETERLLELARKSSSKVMVGFNLRWHRLVCKAREMIQQGALGPLELIRTVLTSYQDNGPEWRKHRALGGGVLFEQAVHHFDLWRFLLQSEVDEVFATSRSDRWEDETAAVTARMANGVVATSVFSQRTGESHDVEVYGQSGRLQISCYRFDGLEYASACTFPGDTLARIRKTANSLRELSQALWKLRHGGEFMDSYRAEWRHFVDCVRRDAPIGSTLEDGKRALQVVLATMASSSLGRPVAVNQAPCRVLPIA